MAFKVNGKEITYPVAKAAVLVGVAIILVLVATIVIPIVGLALGIVLLALGIAIPVIGWKAIIGKVTSKINIDEQERGDVEIESDLFESMSTNKLLKLVARKTDIKITGTDNYNKFSVKCGSMSYSEHDDAIVVYLDEDADITVSRSMALNIMTGIGNTVATNIRKLKIATGSGDVKVTDLHEKLEGAAGAGDFEIHFDKEATQGSVKVATASGDALIVVPDGHSVSFKSSTISGTAKCELPISEEASFKIKFAAASGDLKVISHSEI